MVHRWLSCNSLWKSMHQPKSVWGVHRLQQTRATQAQKVNSYFPVKRAVRTLLGYIHFKVHFEEDQCGGGQTRCGTVSTLPCILRWYTSSKKGKDGGYSLVDWSGQTDEQESDSHVLLPLFLASISEALKELGHNAPLESFFQMIKKEVWVVACTKRRSWCFTHTPHICSG